MPTYEILFTVRRLAKPDLVSCLKRVGEVLLDNHGILRKIEYLGTKKFPYKMPKAGSKTPGLHSSGSYFLFHCDLPYSTNLMISNTLKLDHDLIRVSLHSKNTALPEDYECTLAEEMLPPSYRKSVQNLIKEGRKKRDPKDLGPDAEKW